MSHFLFRLILTVCLLSYAFALMVKGRDGKFLRKSAFSILVLGTALWFYGFSLEDYTEDVITILFRSIRGGLKIFFAEAELWEVEKAQEEPYFLDIFFTVMAAAIFTTISAILSVFGQRIQNLLKLRLSSYNKTYKHIFFNPERGAELLIKSLDDYEDCLCIEYPEGGNDKFSLEEMAENIFKKHEKKTLYDKVTILNAKKSVHSLAKNSTDTLAQLGLKTLKKFIDEETVFYFLSEDDSANISSLVHLDNDPFFKGRKIFVRMSDNDSSRIYEHSFNHIRVKFIYVSSLGSKEILKNKYFHPSVTVDTVKSEFNALVIGFGKVGQNVAEQLLLFADSPEMNGIQSHIHIFDDKLDKRFTEYDLAQKALSDSRLTFENVEPGELSFWKKISDMAEKLDYVVIALESGINNLELSGNLAKCILPKKNGKKVRILVNMLRMPQKNRNLLRLINERCGSAVVGVFGEYKKVFRKEVFFENE